MPGDDGEIMRQKLKRKLTVNTITLFSIFNINIKKHILFIAAIVVQMNISYFAQDTPPTQKIPPPVLKKAVLCEKVLNRTKPINEGVVFSSKLGKLICFTEFDPVYEETFIYHKYYFKDKFSSGPMLRLKPPSYATQTTIQLRESDKGPWRVEITDADGNVIRTIRFSITD